jgi:putative endonuclease
LAPRHNQVCGTAGEELASIWLSAHGFRVIARNVRTPYGELDILAERRGELHVIEVKTRTGTGYGTPFEAIDARKQEHLRKATLSILASGVPGMTARPVSIHIDGLAILMHDASAPCIELLEDMLA